MNSTLLKIFALFFLTGMSFTSCKKDDPSTEDDTNQTEVTDSTNVDTDNPSETSSTNSVDSTENGNSNSGGTSTSQEVAEFTFKTLGDTYKTDGLESSNGVVSQTAGEHKLFQPLFNFTRLYSIEAKNTNTTDIYETGEIEIFFPNKPSSGTFTVVDETTENAQKPASGTCILKASYSQHIGANKATKTLVGQSGTVDLVVVGSTYTATFSDIPADRNGGLKDTVSGSINFTFP